MWNVSRCFTKPKIQASLFVGTHSYVPDPTCTAYGELEARTTTIEIIYPIAECMLGLAIAVLVL